MDNISQNIGIDVGSERLTVSIDGAKPFEISNAAPAIEVLAGGFPPSCTVTIEASGGYERLARRILEARGHRVRVLNPRKSKHLADAMNVGAKTDRVDARFLAEHGGKMPCGRPKSTEQEDLAGLSRAIQRLKDTAAGLRKAMGSPSVGPEASEAYRLSASAMDQQIALLESSFLERVQHSGLATAYSLARSVPGVGPVLARVAVSEIGADLQSLTGGNVASYAGLAPMDDSSGKRTGAKRIKRGNSRIKAALYLPALSCVKRYAWAKSLYTRLRERGRKHSQAIVAVMRKLLVIIFAVVKRGTPWEEKCP